jgi:ATP-binding cassette subfamily B protein
VSGIRVIKSYAQEENQTLRFDQCSKVYEDACNKLAKADSAFHPLMESIIAIGSVTLLWFCSEPVIQDQMTIGTFVAFHEYVRRMVWPMSAIGMSVSMIEQGRASFDRIVDLLKTETDTPDFGKSKLAKLKKISIENLSFRYPTSDRNALSKINLNISAGEVIGLVGSVGAGKTTLLQLLTRLYSVTEGTIQYNGIQIQDISRDELTNKISYVTQDAFLFSDTIASNIALGLPEQDTVPEEFNEMPPHSIVEAANVVNMHEEIHDIPGGYGAYIGERGVSLSGGQKQRLTIARALVRDSEFIILDDSLSAVDAKTEQSIVQALRSALDEEDGENQAKTVIIASHRLATLRHAHRIVVLDQGQIEAVGSHDELLGASPTYRAMYDLQSSHLNSESDLNSNTLQLPSEPRTRKANGYNQSIPT